MYVQCIDASVSIRVPVRAMYGSLSIDAPFSEPTSQLEFDSDDTTVVGS